MKSSSLTRILLGLRLETTTLRLTSSSVQYVTKKLRPFVVVCVVVIATHASKELRDSVRLIIDQINRQAWIARFHDVQRNWGCLPRTPRMRAAGQQQHERAKEGNSWRKTDRTAIGSRGAPHDSAPSRVSRPHFGKGHDAPKENSGKRRLPHAAPGYESALRPRPLTARTISASAIVEPSTEAFAAKR